MERPPTRKKKRLERDNPKGAIEGFLFLRKTIKWKINIKTVKWILKIEDNATKSRRRRLWEGTGTIVGNYREGSATELARKFEGDF